MCATVTNNLGTRLRLARQRAGLAAREAAARIGVPYDTLNRWENGRQEPQGYGLGRIASVYGVTLEWLEGAPDIEAYQSEVVVTMPAAEWACIGKYRNFLNLLCEVDRARPDLAEVLVPGFQINLEAAKRLGPGQVR